MTLVVGTGEAQALETRQDPNRRYTSSRHGGRETQHKEVSCVDEKNGRGPLWRSWTKLRVFV